MHPQLSQTMLDDLAYSTSNSHSSLGV